jgi:hypothetical protein
MRAYMFLPELSFFGVYVRINTQHYTQGRLAALHTFGGIVPFGGLKGKKVGSVDVILNINFGLTLFKFNFKFKFKNVCILLHLILKYTWLFVIDISYKFPASAPHTSNINFMLFLQI